MIGIAVQVMLVAVVLRLISLLEEKNAFQGSKRGYQANELLHVLIYLECYHNHEDGKQDNKYQCRRRRRYHHEHYLHTIPAILLCPNPKMKHYTSLRISISGSGDIRTSLARQTTRSNNDANRALITSQLQLQLLHHLLLLHHLHQIRP